MTRRFYTVTGTVRTETPFSILVEAGNADHAFTLVTGGNIAIEADNLTQNETITEVCAQFADLTAEE